MLQLAEPFQEGQHCNARVGRRNVHLNGSTPHNLALFLRSTDRGCTVCGSDSDLCAALSTGEDLQRRGKQPAADARLEQGGGVGLGCAYAALPQAVDDRGEL